MFTKEELTVIEQLARARYYWLRWKANDDWENTGSLTLLRSLKLLESIAEKAEKHEPCNP